LIPSCPFVCLVFRFPSLKGPFQKVSAQIIALTSSSGRKLEHDSLMDHNKIGKPSFPRPRK
jgi:hypothetical protein